LTDAILAEIEALPEFDETFLDNLRREMHVQDADRRERLREVDARRIALEREQANIVQAIRESGSRPYLIAEADRLEEDLDRLARERDELARLNGAAPKLPSAERIKVEARRAFTDLAVESPGFGRYMKRLITAFLVKPYQLIDGGEVVLRAHFTLNLAPLVNSETDHKTFGTMLERRLVVDLFTPPQRVQHLGKVVEMTANRIKQRDIAAALGITQAAVQSSLALARQMEGMGLSDPYQLVTEPPHP
jgi:hypothetical protein